MSGPPVAAGDRNPWRLAPAGVSWAVAGVFAALVGVLAGRPDVVALGLPLLLGLAWASARPHAAPSDVRLTGRDQAVGPGGPGAAVEIMPTPGSAIVALRVRAPGHRAVQALVPAERRMLPVRMDSVRTGRRPLFGLDVRLTTADGLRSTGVRPVAPIVLTVLPTARPLRDLPLPFRLQGLTGPHRSRRVGDGGELRDLAVFGPGDRTRRIDWRATARLSTGEPGLAVGTLNRLYVRRTFATADATVMLVIDSRDDVGPRLVTWADATALREHEATSLDIARHAAASLAEAYLAGGDRVGVEDLGRLRRPLLPAGGRRQQRRVLQRLALAEPEGEPTPRRRVPRLPSGALLVVLSTFLDDDAADMSLTWRRAGHRVLAVDTLPAVNPTGATPRLVTAYRVVELERQERLHALRAAGVDLFAWTTRASADPADRLAVLARWHERHR